MRFSLRPLVGLVVVLGLIAVLIGLQIALQSPLDPIDVGTTADGMLRGILVPELIVAALLIAAVSVLGWWKPVLRDADGGRRSWWLAVPVLLAVLAAAKFPWGSDIAASFVVTAAITTLTIGFVEEVLVRGVLLVGLRARFSEFGAFALSTVIFGLLHGTNVLTGAPVDGTVSQIVLAMGLGGGLYALRRVTGSLIWPILLHAVWDFFVYAAGGLQLEEGSFAYTMTLMAIGFSFVGGLVAGIVVAKRSGNPQAPVQLRLAAPSSTLGAPSADR